MAERKASKAGGEVDLKAARKLYESAVQRSSVTVDDRQVDSWDAFCLCDPSRGQGFLSEGWPTKALAQARLDQHIEEHVTGVPARPHTDLLADAGERQQAVDIAAALSAAKQSRGR